VLGVGEEQKERIESGEKENVFGVGDQKEREERWKAIILYNDIFPYTQIRGWNSLPV
jgi:hypothetical protein